MPAWSQVLNEVVFGNRRAIANAARGLAEQRRVRLERVEAMRALGVVQGAPEQRLAMPAGARPRS